jgi:hypothetical protein
MHRLKALVIFVPNTKFKRTAKRSRPPGVQDAMSEDEAPVPQMAGPAADKEDLSSCDESGSIISSSDAGSPNDQAEVLDAMPAVPKPLAPAVKLPATTAQWPPDQPAPMGPPAQPA